MQKATYVKLVCILFFPSLLSAQGTLGSVKSHLKISATHSNFSGSLDSYDQFGIDVANIGDLDGDGFEDIVVGANSDDDGGLNKGAVWVLFLIKENVKSYQKISIGNGNFTGQLNDGDYFGGWGISVIDNFNDDGFKDLLVGSYGCNDGGIDAGAVWILSLEGQYPTATLPDLKPEFDITIYPNPNHGQFTISNIPTEKAIVRVWSLEGKLIHELEVQTHKTEVEFFVEQNGIYLVEVISNGQRFVKKVMVQK